MIVRIVDFISFMDPHSHKESDELTLRPVRQGVPNDVARGAIRPHGTSGCSVVAGSSFRCVRLNRLHGFTYCHMVNGDKGGTTMGVDSMESIALRSKVNEPPAFLPAHRLIFTLSWHIEGRFGMPLRQP